MTNEEKKSALDKFEEKELNEKEMDSVKGGKAVDPRKVDLTTAMPGNDFGIDD